MKSNFYIELTHFAQKIKKKLRLNGTCGAKLDFNWIQIWNLIEFFPVFHLYIYIYRERDVGARAQDRILGLGP